MVEPSSAGGESVDHAPRHADSSSPSAATSAPASRPATDGTPTPSQQHAGQAVDLHITDASASNVMDRLLREMEASHNSPPGKGHSKATDLHLNVGRPPDYRIDRVIRSAQSKPFTQSDVIHLSNALMSEKQQERMESRHCVDLSHELDGNRFRVNIVESFVGRSVSIRRFEQIKDFSDYHLPEQYVKIAEQHRGFVLMSGSTGSGKSTSIAAMLDHVNRNFFRKIVTIEDPIEYVYTPRKSIIVQLEIGEDGIPTEDIALRNLVRMDPDVGLAGEMRDRASLEAALKTAQAGHLIFGTLHCEGVGQAFDRILAYYDKSEQARILGTLADNLACIINQRLLPCIRPDVDVVPAYSIFIPNPMTRRMIRELRYADAIAEMESPIMKNIGCVTYVDSLHKLVTDEWVDFHVALEHAGEHSEKLAARVRGIAST